MTSYAQTERAALCSLMEQVGPDHPTLCTGWTTYDLAAHLVLRERRPDAAPGIFLRAMRGRAASVQAQLRERHSFPELIGLLRDGPPRWSVYALPGAEAVANTVEFFVHHEDVRRAGSEWAPRDLHPGQQDMFWSRLRRGGRLFFRRVDVGVRLRRADTGATVQVREGEPAVLVSGLPAELLLYAFNRRAVAQVDVVGDDAAVARLAATRLGL